jgi:thymidylate synthase (FAD)
MNHHVNFVHCTQDGDHLVAYMARVSNPKGQIKDFTKLIRYLIKHKHWSPFEMVNMCVEINTTRSIASQILRHRSFSFQEFSQRYADVSELGDISLPNLRRQDLKNRQNSIDDLRPDCIEIWNRMIEDQFDKSRALYLVLLDGGVAKECAREVLPLATPTRLYMNGSIRSWIHYCDLRCDVSTQLEHRLIADQCKELVKEHFPSIYDAWTTN